jgi:hypothetical protein
MGRVMAAYAEFPGRLLACATPLQFWTEYLRFGQRLFGALCVFPMPTSAARSSKSPTRSAITSPKLDS